MHSMLRPGIGGKIDILMAASQWADRSHYQFVTGNMKKFALTSGASCWVAAVRDVHVFLGVLLIAKNMVPGALRRYT